MTWLLKIASKSLNMLHYRQILDSFFYLWVNTGFVFLFKQIIVGLVHLSLGTSVLEWKKHFWWIILAISHKIWQKLALMFTLAYLNLDSFVKPGSLFRNALIVYKIAHYHTYHEIWKRSTDYHTSVLKCLIRKFRLKSFSFFQNRTRWHLCSWSQMTGPLKDFYVQSHSISANPLTWTWIFG